MEVTVAICTWNRADLLDKTLEQMRELRIPERTEWELLVVNNNCTDNTDEVIARHQKNLPIRRLFEKKPGLSNARNCAMDAALGQLLVWTDDDVLVSEGWLAEYVTAWKRFPSAAYFGGPVEPWYQSTPPEWVIKNQKQLEGVFALKNLSVEMRDMRGQEEPFGANMAYNAERIGERRFNADLGRMRDSLLSGEDVAFVDALRHEGHQGVWVPGARVQHFVEQKRMTATYLWNFYVGWGRSLTRKNGNQPPEGPLFFGAPRWQWRRFLVFAARGWLRKLVRHYDWVEDYMIAAMDWGAIKELRAARQRGDE